jgi:hypothetical protein
MSADEYKLFVKVNAIYYDNGDLTDNEVWTITHANPNNDYIKNREHLATLREKYRDRFTAWDRQYPFFRWLVREAARMRENEHFGKERTFVWWA